MVKFAIDSLEAIDVCVTVIGIGVALLDCPGIVEVVVSAADVVMVALLVVTGALDVVGFALAVVVSDSVVVVATVVVGGVKLAGKIIYVKPTFF